MPKPKQPKPDLSGLSRDELLDRLEAEYVKFKPLNDQIVSIQEQVVEIHAGLYEQALADLLPDVPVQRWKKVAAISCSVNHLAGIPRLTKRVEELRDAGVTVQHIVYDSTLCEFQLFAEDTK